MAWYAAYRQADPEGPELMELVQIVHNDELDDDDIEAQVESKERSMTFSGRFCRECQHQGIFWECRSSRASEFLPDGVPASEIVSPEAGPDEHIWHWPSIATINSSTNLTYGEDRLPALAGVARRQHELTGDKYLAGLWRRHLPTQLLWRRWRWSQRLPRPAWRAPSWSWTAIDSSIRFPIVQDGENLAYRERLIDILEATTEPFGPDTFGLLRSGSITLSCAALVSGYIEWRTGSYAPDLITIGAGSRAGNAITALMDCTPERSTPNIDHVYLLPVFGPLGLTSWGGTHKANKCLPQCSGVDSASSENLIGLVLQRYGDINGVFQRIGSFDLWDRPETNYYEWPSRAAPQKTQGQYYHILKETLEEVGVATAQELCAKVVEAGADNLPDLKYAITVV